MTCEEDVGMGLLRWLKGLGSSARPKPIEPSTAASAEPTGAHLREFFRFTSLDDVVRAERDRLYAAVANGAFCDCMLRIIVRQGEAKTVVEVDALDITTLPAIPRESDYEYLKRLSMESRVLHESATAPHDALERFLADVGSLDWFQIGDDQERGLDGYEFTGAVRDSDGRAHFFSAWCSHKEDSPYFRFLRALHRLACDSAQSWRTVAALDALQPYAGLGEVFRDFGGTPHHVRLSGMIDEENGVALVERLHSLPRDGQVVLDLRELRGLRVTVERALGWAQERSDVKVVVPRRWTELASQVPLERMFEDTDAAIDRAK